MGRSWKGESAEQGRAAAAAAAAEMWPPCCCSRTLFTAHRLCQLDGTLRDSKGERMKTRNRRRAEEGGGEINRLNRRRRRRLFPAVRLLKQTTPKLLFCCSILALMCSAPVCLFFLFNSKLFVSFPSNSPVDPPPAAYIKSNRLYSNLYNSNSE
jgi:hypothetical protein